MFTDSYAIIGAFCAVQFACVAENSFQQGDIAVMRDRVCWQTVGRQTTVCV